MGLKKKITSCVLIFLIMVFKPGPEVDPGQVSGHRSCGLARVTQAMNFFILQICKNDIILVKILQKKKINGF
jgi:hypothetical protein